MLTINYHNITDEQPNDGTHIKFYIAQGDHFSTELYQCRILYEWQYPHGHEECDSDYYYPETESHYKLGDVREDERVLCATITGTDDKSLSQLKVYPVDNDYEPFIFWEYTHNVLRTVYYALPKDSNYFPCFDINSLIKEGTVIVHSCDKRKVGEYGNRYFQIYMNVEYCGKFFHLKCTQDWLNIGSTGDEWLTPKNYAQIEVFQFECIEPDDERIKTVYNNSKPVHFSDENFINALFYYKETTDLTIIDYILEMKTRSDMYYGSD